LGTLPAPLHAAIAAFAPTLVLASAQLARVVEQRPVMHIYIDYDMIDIYGCDINKL